MTIEAYNGISIIAPLSMPIVDPTTGMPSKAFSDFIFNMSLYASQTAGNTTNISNVDNSVGALTITTGNLSNTVGDITTTFTNDITNIGNAITTTNTAVTNLTETVAGNTAALSIESDARATADIAIAGTVTTITATVNNPTTGLAAAQTKITTEISARASADTAIAASVTTLSAQVNDVSTGLPKTRADIATEISARASADTAIAASVTTLSTTVASHTTSITEFSASIDGMEGRWGVVVNGDGHVTGIQLIGSPTGGTFIIDADVIINGSLTTSKIANNAVSYPITATVPSTGYSYGPATLCSFTVTTNAAGFIFAIVSIEQNFSALTGANWAYTLRIDGTIVASNWGTVPGDSVCISGSKTVSGAGTYTVVLQAQTGPYVSIQGGNITAMGFVK